MPLVVLAVLAVGVGWNVPCTDFGVEPLLEQARPAGIAEGHRPAADLAGRDDAGRARLRTSRDPRAGRRWAAFGTALAGFLLATVFYGAAEARSRRRAGGSFAPIYRFLSHKWWFDELYDVVVRAAGAVHLAAGSPTFDKQGDRLAGRQLGPARCAAVARLDDWIDRYFVDGLVNVIGRLDLRRRAAGCAASQTGKLRQYVMFIVVGTVALFVLITFYWNVAAGP